MSNLIYLVNPSLPQDKAYRKDTNIVFEIKDNEITFSAPKFSDTTEFLRVWDSIFEFVRYLVKDKKSILLNEIGNVIKWNTFRKLMIKYKNKVLNYEMKYAVA